MAWKMRRECFHWSSVRSGNNEHLGAASNQRTVGSKPCAILSNAKGNAKSRSAAADYFPNMKIIISAAQVWES